VSRSNGKPGKWDVLIVDDHPVVRHGLAQLINQECDLEVCAQAENATETMTAVAAHPPDVVVLDLSLGENSGLAVIKELRGVLPDLPILILSMHDEFLYAERALRAGANGYIMKEEATSKVIEAIRRVLRGEIHVSERMATRLLGKMVTGASPEVRSPVETLSDRELEVFEMIGRGLKTHDIAERLHISPKTVEAHRGNIKAKLKLKNSIELLQYATQWVQSTSQHAGAGVAEPSPVSLLAKS